jgi:hypothetical protein
VKERVVSDVECGCVGGGSEWSGVITVCQGQAKDGSQRKQGRTHSLENIVNGVWTNELVVCWDGASGSWEAEALRLRVRVAGCWLMSVCGASEWQSQVPVSMRSQNTLFLVRTEGGVIFKAATRL